MFRRNNKKEEEVHSNEFITYQTVADWSRNIGGIVTKQSEKTEQVSQEVRLLQDIVRHQAMQIQSLQNSLATTTRFIEAIHSNVMIKPQNWPQQRELRDNGRNLWRARKAIDLKP